MTEPQEHPEASPNLAVSSFLGMFLGCFRTPYTFCFRYRIFSVWEFGNREVRQLDKVS